MQDGCQERDAFSNTEISAQYNRTDFILINDIVDETGYNGFIYFDRVTASGPLIEN